MSGSCTSLGSLQRFPRPSNWICGGVISRRRRREGGKAGDGRKGKGKKIREGAENLPEINLWIRL